MKRVIAAIAVLLLVTLPCMAEGAVETDKLEQAFPYDLYSDGEFTPESADLKTGLKNLWDTAAAGFRRYIRQSAGAGFLLLALCAAASLASGFIKDAGLKLDLRIVDVALTCMLLTVSFGGAHGVIGECRAAVQRLDGFNTVLIPVFAVSSAVSGRPVSAVSNAGTAMFFSKILTTLSVSLLIPSIYLFIAAAAAGAVSGNSLLSRVAQFIKWASGTVFKIFIMAFTGYLTLSGVIAAASDAAAVKTAQAAISGAVPVVGSIIAGASDVLLSGAAVLRGAIGIYGFIGACAICLTPFIKSFCGLLAFKLLAMAAASFAPKGAAAFLESLADAYSMALGVLGACCAAVFISITVSMAVTAA